MMMLIMAQMMRLVIINDNHESDDDEEEEEEDNDFLFGMPQSAQRPGGFFDQMPFATPRFDGHCQS